MKDVEDREGRGFDFKQFEIYHIKARKNIPIKLQSYMDKDINNCYMVAESLTGEANEWQQEEGGGSGCEYQRRYFRCNVYRIM